MSDNFQELIDDSKTLVNALKRKGSYDGFMSLLTELYPDKAHFIYELLQNAEDALATEVCFILDNNRVEFKHNGEKLFSFDNVKSITNIGVSTKRDEHTSIGKFGVGFKSVFAYTDTPEIESGEYHFRIRDMVVPDITDLPPRTAQEKETRFIFPFDNPKKTPEKACDEIENNLRQLSESTLLFLSNIRKIEYRLPNSASGHLERKDLGKNLIGIITKHPEDSNSSPSVYLRFEKSVNVNDENGDTKSCRIAVAFKLNKTQEHDTEKSGKAENPRLKIEQTKGQVSIYFPAEKETSNLKFHLHAPFASTVARDSVRDCSANNELRDHLTNLIAEAMPIIRDQGLLTTEFLGTLPNDKDNLPAFYKPIQNKLIEVFRRERLVPMKIGGHAPASKIFKSVPTQLSDLINDDDLAQILGKEYQSPLWVKNPPQRNQREDNFLSMLGIQDWNAKDFLERAKAHPKLITEWMVTKSLEWHQQFYAFLEDFWDKNQYFGYGFCTLQIVRVSNGAYKKGNDVYFPSDGVEDDELMPRVAKGAYTSGKNEKEQKAASDFLKRIGVREVGESEQVESILKRKYLTKTHDFDIDDIQRFVAFAEKNPSKVDIFQDCLIIKAFDSEWKKPTDVYLDSPFLETGLSLYFGAIDNKIIKPLSLNYRMCGVEINRLAKFMQAVGAIAKLPITRCSCVGNPEWDYLRRVGGERHTNPVNQDWTIENLDNLLDPSSIRFSKLVWELMSGIDSKYFRATYQVNEKHGSRVAKSQLIHALRDFAWVPQKNQNVDEFNFVKPSDADAKLLPEGFFFNSGWEWLKEVDFGKNDHHREQLKNVEFHQKEATVKELGFDSVEDAKEVAELRKNDPDGFKAWKEQSRNKEKTAFPQRNVRNPERRQDGMAAQIENASGKQYETRERSVRTTSGDIDPKSWLRNQYINESDQVICQICKEEMPFKGRDGEYYFEAVEALSRDYFDGENESQYLALCPLCAAMYKEFVKRDENAMEDFSIAIKNSDNFEIPIKLGKWETSIQFVESHWLYIKKILLDSMGDQY